MKVSRLNAVCILHHNIFWGFKILTKATKDETLFSDVTSCSPLEVHQHFGGMFCFNLQAGTVTQATSNMEATSRMRKCL